jgi:hypothetical protein
MNYQQLMLLPEGKSICDFFDDEQSYQTFSDDIKQLLGIDNQLLSRFKPLMFCHC